jgi:hypothetical protein
MIVNMEVEHQNQQLLEHRLATLSPADRAFVFADAERAAESRTPGFTVDAVLVKPALHELRDQVAQLEYKRRWQIRETVEAALICAGLARVLREIKKRISDEQDEIISRYDDHDRTVWAAIKSGKKGYNYALELHRLVARTPMAWRIDPVFTCSSFYPEAFSGKDCEHWREEIAKEKAALKDRVRKALKNRRAFEGTDKY